MLNRLISDLKDNSKKAELEYLKKIAGLENTILVNKENFIKEKKDL